MMLSEQKEGKHAESNQAELGDRRSGAVAE
jgi:hypothetical protein